jgi:hypothetical protein
MHRRKDKFRPLGNSNESRTGGWGLNLKIASNKGKDPGNLPRFKKR